MNILEVQDLCKTYGTGETEVHALNHVSFSVRKGEFIAIIGESGSGKSTLLNVIGALDSATSGKVWIDGQDIFSMPEKKLTVFRRQHIGFIFQSFNLIPELNVEQNITFPLLLDYKKPNQKFVNELLQVLGLSERRKHLPSQLSGGQQQRVAIGRALVTRPALIMADEPTGNLDSKNSQEVLALLQTMSDRYQQTILMITHNKNHASAADRVFRMTDGVLKRFGGVVALKSYLGLVPQYEKVHRKNNRISVLCIVLSVLLVTAIFSMADMALRAQKNYFIKTNGEYHISLTDIDEQTAELVKARIDVSLCGWAYQGSTGSIGSKAVSFAGANEDTFSTLTEMDMESGSYPTQPDEALLNRSALEQLGLAVGDTVTVTVPDGSSREYRITGVLADMGSLLKADVYGMVLTEDGFRQIADENAQNGTTFRVQFKDGVNIQEAMNEIKTQYGLSDSQVSENTALLGLMGQSENSTMQSLYIVAGFLVLLVLIAGAVMIAASFNTNVLERVQFYGLLRCLGASKAQVKHFVLLQGLRQSMKGVPIGLVAGQIITWCACLLLKSISGERFSEIPLFQFSVSGLIAGAVIGFLIVLLASLSPAKKASKVSPVTAISGSTQLTQNKRAANTKLFHIETSMGIFHALSGKKNVFLMTCSFAISIMMFLSFQVMVVFLNQGMPALSPSAADVSITMGNTPLDKSLVEQISETEGVDKVFGRMEMAGLSVSSDTEEGTITLISYDDNQFGWAKEELNEGSITPAMENTDRVLVAYQDGVNWNVGDTVVLHTSSGDKQVTIAGILATATASAVNGAGSSGYIICSEQTFTALVGELGYTTIDVQFSSAGGDDTVSTIRSMIPYDSTVSDRRITNSESQSSYYTGAVFIYGFLIIIALITVFNIFNSMNASVASRTRQYGIMRSIGMGANQLYKMIAAEAFTYAILGCIVGCILGLPLNRLMFQFLIADKWGTAWQIPVGSLLLIVFLCLASAAVAIRRPIRQISRMAIVDTIKLQQ